MFPVWFLLALLGMHECVMTEVSNYISVQIADDEWVEGDLVGQGVQVQYMKLRLKCAFAQGLYSAQTLIKKTVRM